MANDDDGPFPILQLPDTMKAMIPPKLSVLDLYNLSHVSDDSKNWVKDYVRNKNYRLKIWTGSEYEVRLLNSDNQGFDVVFEDYEDDGNAEFFFGNFPVITRNVVTAPNWMEIVVLSRRLDAQWDKNEAIKSFIAHLSEVFTKDVCISILSEGEQNENTIKDLARDLQLNVHCFFTETNSSSARIEDYPKCKRLCFRHGNIDARQMRLQFQQWMENGTMDYFEVAGLPKTFNINYVMRGDEYTTSPRSRLRISIRNYSVTRADGVAATVTFTPQYTLTHLGWQDYHENASFVLECETAPPPPLSHRTTLVRFLALNEMCPIVTHNYLLFFLVIPASVQPSANPPQPFLSLRSYLQP